MVEWVTGSNAFFSLTVRIQKERGQAVVEGGPYRFARHPSYVGTILFELAAPIILGSWWALIPGRLNAILFVVRTALEDGALQAELATGCCRACARNARGRIPSTVVISFFGI